MPATLIDLRPDRRLLDHEFEGYKLNLQALPHYSHQLECAVDRVYPDEIQFSFVHAKLFALHNHLVFDYWDYSFCHYYIDVKQQVRQVNFDDTVKTFRTTVVYDIPAHVERKSGHFNLCLAFPSDSLAVVSDGTGYLHIVNTERRVGSSKTMWQTLHSTPVLGENNYFIIVDTRLQDKDNTEMLHCLLQSVEHSANHFYSVLTWVTFLVDGQSWKQISIRQIQGRGIVHYACIETSFNAVYIASDNPFKFTQDSEKDIVENVKTDARQIIYTWMQTTEDITVTLQLQSNFDKKLLSVSVTPCSIKVSYSGKVFLDGKLTNKVDSELTTWNVQETGQVDILITKSDSTLWKDLMECGDINGEQIIDASLVEEAHQRLAHLCSETEVAVDQSAPGFSTQELEECDAASEEDTILTRLEAEHHQITHRIPLSMNQYLFNVKLDTTEVPALVLRHDVDACVWQPYAELINSNRWPIKHQGTLMAFGYVQSSKQNRKFVTCSPNFSYSVVCESLKHLFVYQNENSQDCQLRQRIGGVMRSVKVGQQHVFNIDRYGEVLGIHAMNHYLFVLTAKTLLVIGIQ